MASTERNQPLTCDGGRYFAHSKRHALRSPLASHHHHTWFGFRFERVGLARSLGGSWQTFAPGYTFRDRGYTLRQLSPAPQRHRTLSAGAPQAYAFDAQST